jgi:hypothetical protein
MMTRGPRPVIDDEVTSIARRYRREAAATLVTVCRDEDAPASARAQAATKLLEYADGRPVAAKQVTVTDVAAMTDEQRQELLHALLTHYETEMPGQFKAMMTEAFSEAMARQALPAPQRTNRFRRGAPRPPLIAQPGNRLPGVSSLKVEAAAIAHTPEHDLSAKNALQAISANVPKPDLYNVVGMPNLPTNPLLGNNVPGATAHPNGISPETLARSARPPNDLAFDGYGFNRWRPR